MLKKMRRRVIAAAMAAFFAVVMLVAVLVNGVNYAVVTKNADNVLSVIASYEGGMPGDPGPGKMPGNPGIEDPDRTPQNPMESGNDKNPQQRPGGPIMMLPDVEANYMTRFFVVRFDQNDNVDAVSMDYIAAVGEEDAVTMAREAVQKGSERGYMNAYRYAVVTGEDGIIRVIFLNTMREQMYMRSLLILTLIVSAGSLLIVFVLVTLLSRRAIRPIANNIRQQKQFITDASHELKTPITSISASVDVIGMEHGEDEWTENIRKQSGRMSKLVSELVTLSRLDEDMPLPEKEEFSLSNAAWEIAEVYKPQAIAKEKEFEIDIAEDISMVGDKVSIQKMLSVLLDNAFRYSDEKGRIAFRVGKKRNHIDIEIANTCRFENPPDVDRLFDRFYRPDASRNADTGGSGLGLAIAKAVAEAHGGEIRAKCPDGSLMTIQIRF